VDGRFAASEVPAASAAEPPGSRAAALVERPGAEPPRAGPVAVTTDPPSVAYAEGPAEAGASPVAWDDSTAECDPSRGVEADPWLLPSAGEADLLSGSREAIDGAGPLATPWTDPAPGFVVVVESEVEGEGGVIDVGAEEPEEPGVEEGAELVDVG
jgi:hypothetical protein